MPEPIHFFVPGKPKGQPRPKATIRGKHAGVYDPGTANDWKLQVSIAAKDHIPAEPLTGPIMISMEFRMPRPQGHYGTGRNAQTLKASSPFYHTGAPDCDNLAKAVLDQLTQCQMWCDDCAVVSLHVGKRYHEKPGCQIHIEQVAADPVQGLILANGGGVA